MDEKIGYRDLEQYSVSEIYEKLESLKKSYDMIQLVDVQECRVLVPQADGAIHYGQECFKLWNRGVRCANCAGYQACMTHEVKERVDMVHGSKQLVHSIPVCLELPDGEFCQCVIDCVTNTDNSVPDEHDLRDDYVYFSTHDVLTRLYTQDKLFLEIRQRLMDRPENRYLLVMGNIRKFKLLNKLFGVEGGNRILIGIADILRESCTGEEVYGRYRDDRFVLLIRKDRFHEEDFMRRLQRVNDLVHSPIYELQVQVGVYEITNVDMPVAAMIDHADLALHAIHHSHERMIAYYVEGMMSEKLHRQHIIAEFEQDLTNNRFRIYLQPQVKDDGMVRGAEALVRRVDADGQVLLPADFLGVLHQSGLLFHLDAYVWEEAVKQLARWKGTEFDKMYISVNVDPSDFFYLDVPKKLQELCAKYEVPTSLLRVEITETALVNDIKNQSHIVEHLQNAGFIVEIDDFGKGSSSLSMLKDVNADVLKIDMGFVSGDSHLNRGNVILESIIEMAVHLCMGVITEGVETRTQVENLIRLGCHNFQGFYFSRPIPVSDFEAVVRLRNRQREEQK